MYDPLLRLRRPILALSLCLTAQMTTAQDDADLTVKQVMNAIITPMTTTIWGAYQLQADAEWQAIENAALTVIAAGKLMRDASASEAEQAWASETDWQRYNDEMIAAARQVISAVQARDEEALSNAGNDALYPPCESCHQQYQPR